MKEIVIFLLFSCLFPLHQVSMYGMKTKGWSDNKLILRMGAWARPPLHLLTSAAG